MTAHDEPGKEQLDDASLLGRLPPGAVIQRVAFVAEKATGPNVLLEFPAAIGRWAVIVADAADRPPSAADDDLLVLAVPIVADDMVDETHGEIFAQVRAWTDDIAVVEPAPCTPRQSLMMTLQGVKVFWNHGRLAILAPPERIETVRKALVEVSFYEAALRDIERTLGAAWPQLDADMPLAFESSDRSTGERAQLRERFQQVLRLRAQLARLAPHVHCPHLHPPTLASQAAERLRDRTQLVHRHEFVDDQVDVFERVYEMCSQRANDFKLTQSSNLLEWIIIALLLAQCVFIGMELLTGMSP